MRKDLCRMSDIMVLFIPILVPVLDWFADWADIPAQTGGRPIGEVLWQAGNQYNADMFSTSTISSAYKGRTNVLRLRKERKS
tara:strand:+ start:74 stop:319 length:246 start_codon:yes stop_codon:yes gene_type:complete